MGARARHHLRRRPRTARDGDFIQVAVLERRLVAEANAIIGAAGLLTPAEQDLTAAAQLTPSANGGIDIALKLVRASDETPERVVTLRIAE